MENRKKKIVISREEGLQFEWAEWMITAGLDSLGMGDALAIATGNVDCKASNRVARQSHNCVAMDLHTMI